MIETNLKFHLYPQGKHNEIHRLFIHLIYISKSPFETLNPLVDKTMSEIKLRFQEIEIDKFQFFFKYL